MDRERYFQPDSCQINRKYYLKISENGSGPNYRQVRFISYRPHPAEVMVHDGTRSRVIHRVDLYQKAADEGEVE